MRTLGVVIMIAAVLAVFAVAAGYQPYPQSLREYLRSGEWPVRSQYRLKLLEKYSAWTVFLSLVLVFGVGWVLHRFG
jgi:hypothetical protein